MDTVRYMRTKYGLLLLFGVVIFAGCVGPRYKTPAVEMPPAWDEQTYVTSEQATYEQWWMRFNDTSLDALIEEARGNNRDLRVAISRVEESRALRKATQGQWLPEINLVGSASRYSASENVLPTSMFVSGVRDDFQGGVEASWELDVFGRVRRSVESARAREEALQDDANGVWLALLADVAATYVEVRTADARLGYALANVERQKGTLTLTSARYKAGLVPALDVHQAQLNLSQTESLIPLLRQLRQSAVSRLAILVGRSPQQFALTVSPKRAIPQQAIAPEIQLPAELVRRRPDIRAAERRLAAETATLGAARTELYPRFALDGYYVLHSSETDTFGDPESEAYQARALFKWNLFKGGQVRNFVNAQNLRVDQTLATYENTVLSALQDVETSLVTYAQEQERLTHLNTAVRSASESVRLVKVLYKSGLTNFQNVLDMERSLANQEDRMAEAQGSVAHYAIRLYRALGGGWETTTETQKEPQ